MPPREPFIIPCGYAGGIGPSTITSVLVAVAGIAAGSAVWVDMESSLRMIVANKTVVVDNEGVSSERQELTDVFSIDRCFQCVIAGVALGLPTVN